jgi:hypothetical protein
LARVRQTGSPARPSPCTARGEKERNLAAGKQENRKKRKSRSIFRDASRYLVGHGYAGCDLHQARLNGRGAIEHAAPGCSSNISVALRDLQNPSQLHARGVGRNLGLAARVLNGQGQGLVFLRLGETAASSTRPTSSVLFRLTVTMLEARNTGVFGFSSPARGSS